SLRARRRGFPALPSSASREPQALPSDIELLGFFRALHDEAKARGRSIIQCSRGPTPARSALGGAASPRFPPAPRASRRRFPQTSSSSASSARSMMKRKRADAALSNARGAPPPLAPRSAARLRRASLQRLARAAGASLR